MSLNLGPAAFDAIQNLKNNRDWERFREALHEVWEKYAHTALEVSVEQRADACGYARAFRDLVVAIEQSVQGGGAASRGYKPPIKSQQAQQRT